MEEARHEIGDVNAFKAEAIGPPGKRTFRLLVDARRGGACLWIEKEQLYGLALAIRRILGTTSGEKGTDSDLEAFADPSEYQTLEFKIGRLRMGYDEEGGRFIFFVHDIDVIPEGEEEPDEEEASEVPPTLSFRARRPQLAALAEEALRVCAAGRPICPLCQNPMDPQGHFCPRTNGQPPRREPERGP